jgi:hypothetical protein
MEQGLAYQLALMQKPRERSPVDMVTGGGYGFRHNSSQPKGEGWLGNVGDNREAITEYSTEYQGREIPTLVPGLSKEQVARVVDRARKEAPLGRENDDVVGLAMKWADDRAKLGYGPFKD